MWRWSFHHLTLSWPSRSGLQNILLSVGILCTSQSGEAAFFLLATCMLAYWVRRCAHAVATAAAFKKIASMKQLPENTSWLECIILPQSMQKEIWSSKSDVKILTSAELVRISPLTITNYSGRSFILLPDDYCGNVIEMSVGRRFNVYHEISHALRDGSDIWSSRYYRPINAVFLMILVVFIPGSVGWLFDVLFFCSLITFLATVNGGIRRSEGETIADRFAIAALWQEHQGSAITRMQRLREQFKEQEQEDNAVRAEAGEKDDDGFLWTHRRWNIENLLHQFSRIADGRRSSALSPHLDFSDVWFEWLFAALAFAYGWQIGANPAVRSSLSAWADISVIATLILPPIEWSASGISRSASAKLHSFTTGGKRNVE